jgi:hypothetical protein
MIENSYWMNEMNVKPIRISNKVQDKTRVELSFTGVPDSTVGLNVFEYDGVVQGLSNDITKERLLKYLTLYEQVPFFTMPTMSSVPQSVMDRREIKSEKDLKKRSKDILLDEKLTVDRRTISEQDEVELMNRERMVFE